MNTLLFEIGSEEIPARFVNSGLEMLKSEMTRMLEQERISHGKITGFSTPRRLAVIIEGLSDAQSDRTTEAVGPPARVAFDESGAPTKAAQGFARSMNVDVSSLYRKKTPKGEYVAVTIEEKGRATIDVLSARLPELISSLQLPRSMRWGSGDLRYYRPIHWIVAILGRDIIPFELDGIRSGNTTRGHRFLTPDAIVINEPAAYHAVLRDHDVIADFTERRALILNSLRDEGRRKNVRVVEDDELLDIVTNLVESPSVVSCSFEEQYLELPRELLVTVMKSHQKYFSTESGEGNMSNTFMVISNTSPDNAATVRKGAERVLRARLEDARFYFLQDRETPLDEMINALKKVTFQDRLGSVHEKARRIEAVSLRLADVTGHGKAEVVSRAAMLCKADLVTGVVGEFPELQGYMGMTYALLAGEDEEVARAVYEHYMPRFAGDVLPETATGAIVSIADKIDNVASFFSLGMIPSGSEDPFALRRQAAGIIQILGDKGISIDVDTLVDYALAGLGLENEERKEALKEDIIRFFTVRLEGLLAQQGYPHDIIQASVGTRPLEINEVRRKAALLEKIKRSPGFPDLIPAAKRVCNILAGHKPGKLNESLFSHESERNLLVAAEDAGRRLTADGEKVLFRLIDPVNEFFDSVLVMDRDERVKENRLALLSKVKEIFDSFGDFSSLEEQ
jgi:glycyl-tRNA synthetase beta chain